MPAEFSTALFNLLEDELSDQDVTERVSVYKSGGPGAGTVTYAVEYTPSGDPLGRILSVTVDVDVWADGPDAMGAEDIASKIESLLLDYTTTTDRQGVVRLTSSSRSYVDEPTEALAHVTMRFFGRCFRR